LSSASQVLLIHAKLSHFDKQEVKLKSFYFVNSGGEEKVKLEAATGKVKQSWPIAELCFQFEQNK